jgi:hypothetical protein
VIGKAVGQIDGLTDVALAVREVERIDAAESVVEREEGGGSCVCGH